MFRALFYTRCGVEVECGAPLMIIMGTLKLLLIAATNFSTLVHLAGTNFSVFLSDPSKTNLNLYMIQNNACT